MPERLRPAKLEGARRRLDDLVARGVAPEMIEAAICRVVELSAAPGEE